MSRPPQGNISLIVLFVLTISGLIGLLVSTNVQSIIASFSSTYGFYRSQYYTKAATELGMVINNIYELGFEDSISGSSAIQQNFHCNHCGFELDIRNRAKHGQYLTAQGIADTCNANNAITLQEGQSIVIPLFYDARKITDANDSIHAKGKQYQSILAEDFNEGVNNGYDQNILITLPTAKTNQKYDIMLSFSPLSKSIDYKGSFLGYYQTSNTNSGRNIINEFLYERQKGKYDSKIATFRDNKTFLSLSFPTHCPTNSNNPNTILDLNQQNYGCKCPQGLYNKNNNTCPSSSSLSNTSDTSIPSHTSLLNQSTSNLSSPIPDNKRSIQFCLKMGQNMTHGVPTPFTDINAFGHYQQRETSLQTKVYSEIPSRLLDTAINR